MKGADTRLVWLWCLVVVLGLGSYARAQSAVNEAFYRDKTLRVVVGFAAGGGFDASARVLARHLGRHIPGHPGIVVENMPGAGSLIAANHLYRVARPDGLTVGQFAGSMLLGQVLGYPGIQFDARRFAYLGAIARELVACAFARSSGIENLDQWAAARVPVKLGAQAPGAASHRHATRLAGRPGVADPSRRGIPGHRRDPPCGRSRGSRRSVLQLGLHAVDLGGGPGERSGTSGASVGTGGPSKTFPECPPRSRTSPDRGREGA